MTTTITSSVSRVVVFACVAVTLASTFASAQRPHRTVHAVRGIGLLARALRHDEEETAEGAKIAETAQRRLLLLDQSRRPTALGSDVVQAFRPASTRRT